MYEYDLGSCIKCPEAQACLTRLAMVAGMKDLVVFVAMDPVVEQRSEFVYSAFKDTGFLALMETMAGEPITDPDQLIKALRKSIGDGLEDIDGQIAAEKAKLDSLTTNCDNGPLRMRATRAGRIVTATICDSPQKPDGHSHETVAVDRAAKPH